MSHRPGVTLPELIFVSWLFGLVLLTLAEFAGAQSRLVAATHDRIRRADLLRTTDIVLGSELRTLTGSDLRPLSPHTIRIRAVRGSGPLCGRIGPSDVLVRYRGIRRPNPDKDSVLFIAQESTTGSAYGLEAVMRDSACGGALRLRASSKVEVASGLVMVYETGEYSVANGAVRYRRGGGGRQPLTEAVLEGGEIIPTAQGALSFSLRFHRDSLRHAPDELLAIERLNQPASQ